MGKILLPLASAATAIGMTGLSAPAHAAGFVEYAGLSAPTAHASATASKTVGDVNGDGYADSVVAAPTGTVHGQSKAGYVVVTYGSASGVNTAHHQGISQAHAGVPGTVEADDHFGSSLAVGDINGDGHADLVIGSDGEDVGSATDTGSITVLFGSASGLSNKAIVLHEPTNTDGQNFGKTLTVGDFDHDGFADIAAGDGDAASGKVWLAYGSNGASSKPPVVGGFTPGDHNTGTDALATGDVNGDGFADLIDEHYPDDPGVDTVDLFPGSKDGVATTRLGSGYISTSIGATALAVGDINGDGDADLVYGGDSGQPTVYPGTKDGFDTDNSVPWKGKPVDGAGIRLSDVDGDGHADLVAANPESEASGATAGAITVLKGTSNWLTDTGRQEFTLATSGVPGDVEDGDEFGADVAPADYNGDGIDDLAIGVPGKDAGGDVSVLYGSSSGVRADGSILFGPQDVNWPVDQATFGRVLGYAPGA